MGIQYMRLSDQIQIISCGQGGGGLELINFHVWLYVEGNIVQLWVLVTRNGMNERDEQP